MYKTQVFLSRNSRSSRSWWFLYYQSMKVVIDKKYLNEYRCKGCDKLLCKGYLQQVDNYLEVKCRNCKRVCSYGEKDAEIIRVRSVLI